MLTVALRCTKLIPFSKAIMIITVSVLQKIHSVWIILVYLVGNINLQYLLDLKWF